MTKARIEFQPSAQFSHTKGVIPRVTVNGQDLANVKTLRELRNGDVVIEYDEDAELTLPSGTFEVVTLG